MMFRNWIYKVLMTYYQTFIGCFNRLLYQGCFCMMLSDHSASFTE